MKTFEQICDTFKKMSVVTNATEEFPVQLDVERITLGYSLVSEPDSFDTALLVPVWDFIGTKTIEHEKKENSIILTINAIDGSIINRELGY